MAIKKRGDAWQVIVYCGGTKHRRSSRVWSKADARSIERQMLEQAQDIKAGRTPARTFNHAVARWRAEELPALKNPNKHLSMLALIAPYLEGRKLEDGPDIAARMRQDYQRQHLSPATVNRRMAVVRRLLSLAYRRWAWLEQPLHQRIQMLPERGQRHVYLSVDDVERLAAVCPTASDAVLLAAYTGIRRGQLLRLGSSNRVGDCLHLGTDGKTGRPQLIPLHPRIQHIQLPLSVTDTSLRNEWAQAKARLGMEDLRFHDLRHTCASWLLQSGADLKHVQEILGHSTVTVTQRYAHLATGHLRDAINRIGAQKQAQDDDELVPNLRRIR